MPPFYLYWAHCFLDRNYRMAHLIYQAFYAAFLMALAWIAEARGEGVVGLESFKTLLEFPVLSLADFLQSPSQIVVDQNRKHTAKKGKAPHMAFKEGLLPFAGETLH